MSCCLCSFVCIEVGFEFVLLLQALQQFSSLIWVLRPWLWVSLAVSVPLSDILVLLIFDFYWTLIVHLVPLFLSKTSTSTQTDHDTLHNIQQQQKRIVISVTDTGLIKPLLDTVLLCSNLHVALSCLWFLSNEPCTNPLLFKAHCPILHWLTVAMHGEVGCICLSSPRSLIKFLHTLFLKRRTAVPNNPVYPDQFYRLAFVFTVVARLLLSGVLLLLSSEMAIPSICLFMWHHFSSPDGKGLHHMCGKTNWLPAVHQLWTCWGNDMQSDRLTITVLWTMK